MLDFIFLNSQAFLNGELIFRAFLNAFYKESGERININMVNTYIKNINKRFQTGISTEHTFRADLQAVLESFDKSILVTNEPTRIECGAPDFIITNNNIPIGYIEAKDIGISLKNVENNAQLKRYRESLENLILTDYLEFRHYRNGNLVTSVTIAEIKDNKIVPIPAFYDAFENLITDFYTPIGQTIKTPLRLAEMMAGKARMMQAIIEKAITSDDVNEQNSTLKDQMLAFQKILIHDIKPSDFADVYAQTIAYGMFAARLFDETLEDFSRQEAAELIPKTNPFLRSLFAYISGPDIDDRILWIVDALADIFRASHVAELMKNFGSMTQQTDPVIHFYETFLSKYNPKLRKSRGVWYTPEPVVKFIVRAVDDILQNEFGLTAGLADHSKINAEMMVQGFGKTRKDVHRVQILDPATGTGTFLAEVVNHIYEQFKNQQGLWCSYIEEHLIPRMNGFEILMAPYTMAHIKLGLLLKKTGFNSTKNERFRIFLTNSLEAAHEDTGTLFTRWLSRESSEANLIKQDTPVMVVIGNPPYSGESVNKGKWITHLMDDYKKEPGGKIKLQEKNAKWINDDYVKFIRYSQHFIEKNKEGILAFINNNSFLDNPTFRGMRWNLLTVFDKIYIIDLHGNSKKKECCPDGSKDENVFDIQQGVSINIFVKQSKNKKLGEIFHYDLYGNRQYKYDFLLNHRLMDINFLKLPNVKPHYFFVKKDFEKENIYKKGFSLTDLFKVNSVGIVTARDAFTIHDSPQKVKQVINDFVLLENEEARSKYKLGKDVRDWKVSFAKNDLLKSRLKESNIVKIAYRPFDHRYTYYTGTLKGFHCRPRGEVMKHFIKGENVGIALCKQFKTGHQYVHTFISRQIIESSYVSNRTSEITYVLPLYLYSDIKEQHSQDQTKYREPNLNSEIVQKLSQLMKMNFTPEKENTNDTFAPIDICDYIYAVLHAPAYREKFKEFLKIDFPRIPYPKNKKIFWQLVEIGSELRTVHLLENQIVEKYITSYPNAGDNSVTKSISQKSFEMIDSQNGTGRVWINDTQYFDNVPITAWEFYIGGYQPAQKWLKDRKGHQLGFDDILHYQKIIAALSHTKRLMEKSVMGVV